MKKILNHLIVISVLAFFGCSNNNNNSQQTSAPETINRGNPIEHSSIEVLLKVFVIDRKGVNFVEKMDENSNKVGFSEFGSELEVIEITEKWLGISERISRTFTNEKGKTIEQNAWEKVYVPKNATGTIDQIQLIQSDLNIINSMTIKGKTENFDEGKQLNQFLKLELIDKKTFDKNRETAVNFLLADTVETKKVNGVISLKCENKIKKIVDKSQPEIDEDVQTFTYHGQIEFLNKYLIEGSYWESGDFKLIDKKTGIETNAFAEFPHISPDKSHIICIATNPYDFSADLEFYSNKNTKIEHLMSASFKNWIPNEIFWSIDGCLYLSVNHAKAIFSAESLKLKEFQYLKINL
jgi:hypothetical protein